MTVDFLPDTAVMSALHRVGLQPLPHTLDAIAEYGLAPFRREVRDFAEGFRGDTRRMARGISFHFADDLSFNAAAVSRGEVELVAINAGLALALPSLFQLLLSMPFEGEAHGQWHAQESTPIDRLLSLSGQLAGTNRGQWLLGPPWARGVPARVGRHAARLCFLAWEFLLCHEVAHIIRCHVAFMTERLFPQRCGGQADALLEFGVTSIETERRLHQILEIDADVVATRLQLLGIRTNPPETFKARFRSLLPDPELQWTWERECRDWLGAVGILFLLLALCDNRLLEDGGRSHPQADVRMSFLAGGAAIEMWEAVGISSQRYESMAAEVRSSIDSLLYSGYLRVPPAYSHPEYKGSYYRRRDALHQDWLDLVPRLNELMEARYARPLPSAI